MKHKIDKVHVPVFKAYKKNQYWPFNKQTLRPSLSKIIE